MGYTKGEWRSENDETELGVIKGLDTYDWFQAFAYAPPGIERSDVVEVIASVEGERDADNWTGIFRLKDGRYLYLTAGCDYTGWDCRASGHGDTRATLVEVIAELCTDDDRKRLGLAL